MSQPRSDSAIEARFDAVVEAFRDDRAATPPGGTGFGSSALKVGGKIFAMLTPRGEFVVKLPRARVEALVAAGDGVRFDPGHGRPMKEWLAMAPDSEADWLALAREARAFVAERH